LIRLPFLPALAGAAPERAAQVAQLRAPLDQLDLPPRWPPGNAATPPLPPERAMRRLRNLLVCGLIRRDLEGQANLNEVVTAMTRFADFAIRTHVDASWPRLVAAHGMPSARFGRGTA
jgi:glutamate-ammonia-ligase adenylyltransferase